MPHSKTKVTIVPTCCPPGLKVTIRFSSGASEPSGHMVFRNASGPGTQPLPNIFRGETSGPPMIPGRPIFERTSRGRTGPYVSVPTLDRTGPPMIPGRPIFGRTTEPRDGTHMGFRTDGGEVSGIVNSDRDISLLLRKAEMSGFNGSLGLLKSGIDRALQTQESVVLNPPSAKGRKWYISIWVDPKGWKIRLIF